MSWERGSVLTAPPFGYSPELPLRRPGGPKARPASSRFAAALESASPQPLPSAAPCGLPAGIARSLRRLRGLHQRLSLCRVSLAPGCDSRLARIDDRSLIAELADDGALIVIFIHPPGVDDAAAASGICTRLEQALRHGGVPLGALRIAVMHCDAAAIDESDATRDALMSLPARPLLSAAGRAALSA
ncbi:MAG: hypothetical protein Kow00114_01700 [Kiloniellaceae bacterium]